MDNRKHMKIEDRRKLEGLLKVTQNNKELGSRLGFSHKTIERDRARGTANGIYSAKSAQDRIDSGRDTNAKSRVKLLKNKAWSNELATALVPGESTPDSICGVKSQEKVVFVCTKTVYNYIHRKGNEKLRSQLTYKKPYKKTETIQGKRPTDSRNIADRPTEAEERTDSGHTEIDLVMNSRDIGGGVLSLVCRKLRVSFIIHVASKNKEEVNRALRELIDREGLKRRLKTITSDNGKEFFGLKDLEEEFGFKQYYADPYSSWQRGTNEQYNGQLRKILPKGTNCRLISVDELRRIQEALNNKPRKILGYKTPNQLFLSK